MPQIDQQQLESWRRGDRLAAAWRRHRCRLAAWGLAAIVLLITWVRLAAGGR